MDGSAPAEDDISSAPTTVRIRTKDGRIHRIILPDEILIAWPNGLPPQFLRNLATIASNRSGRSQADRRAATAHPYRRLYRRGFPLKKLLRSATETFDTRELEVVTTSLAREINDRKKAEINWPDFDVAICHLAAVGRLADCTAEEGAERVTKFLREHGVPQNLTADAYRQRVKRLRRDGVKF